MGVPLLVFMILLWLGREDLGVKGILACLLICVVLLLGSAFLHISPYVFIALLALFDIILILVLFGGARALRFGFAGGRLGFGRAWARGVLDLRFTI